MNDDADRVVVTLTVEVGETADERFEATGRLLQELRDLDVDDVKRAPGGQAPDGARAIDILAVGTLIATSVRGAATVAEIVGTVRGWLSRRPRDRPGTVRIKLGDDEIVISGDMSPDQARLVTHWIERHA